MGLEVVLVSLCGFAQSWTRCPKGPLINVENMTSAVMTTEQTPSADEQETISFPFDTSTVTHGYDSNQESMTHRGHRFQQAAASEKAAFLDSGVKCHECFLEYRPCSPHPYQRPPVLTESPTATMSCL